LADEGTSNFLMVISIILLWNSQLWDTGSATSTKEMQRLKILWPAFLTLSTLWNGLLYLSDIFFRYLIALNMLLLLNGIYPLAALMNPITNLTLPVFLA